ncbi:MAG: ribonuclease D [Actinomycetes bacterium]
MARIGDTPSTVRSAANHAAATAGTDEIAALAARAKETGRLAIDTEFMGEGRYRSLLCLVQVATDSEVEGDPPLIALADPLTDPAPDCSSLAELLADPEVEIVLHAGRQDTALLRREWGVEITNLFDTQIAAGFAGFGAQAGYGNLLAAALGIKVEKGASYTRWDKRPLSDEQLSYARGDVDHLLDLRDELVNRLTETGRLDWAREECLPIAAATDYREPLEAWRRVGKASSLSAPQRAVARELAAWREDTALSEDKPVGSIIQDPALVELARRQPQDDKALRDIRGLHEGILRKRGEAIIAAVARGVAADPIPSEGRGDGGDSRETALCSLADALVRTRTRASDLAPELVATRSDLQRIVTSVRRDEPEPDVRTLQGWRREVVGAELLDLLHGRTALAVGDDLLVEALPRPTS